ncbi:MAG: hypothetical protein J2P17_04285, partial [Mycobacterium sp.]|nr:hypothetical protein [Mycobacterium sp.]
DRYSLVYTYDSVVDVYVESITDSFGYVSNSTHDFKFGEVASTTDENGQLITNKYDSVGRLIQVIGPYQRQPTPSNPNPDPTIAITYAPVDPAHAPRVPWAVTSHIDGLLDCSLVSGHPATCPDNHIETVQFIDGLKRALQTKKDAYAVDPGPATGGSTSLNPVHVMVVSGRVVFDALGRTIAQFYPVVETAPSPQCTFIPPTACSSSEGTFNVTFDGAAPRPTTSVYDILDRVTSVTIADGTTTSLSYDFGADRFGQTRFRTTAIDAKGGRGEQYHDIRSQVVTVNEFNGSAVYHTSYTYDPVRQITSVTDDQGNVTSVNYDLFGRRTAINSPDAGLTAFTYDLADNLITKQTANLATAGQLVKFNYQFNRLASITYPNFPGNNVTYTYGAASQRQSPPALTGNVVGRITHIADGAGTEDRLYGPLGEIVSETRAVPIQGGQVGTYTTTFTYDTWNRVAQMVYPDTPGETLTYTYDFGGLPYRVHGNDDQLEQDYASNIFYDKFGHRLQMVYGNGAVTTYAYDKATQRITNVQAELPPVPGGEIFHNFQFGYDVIGNLTSLQNAVAAPPTHAIGGPEFKTFGYDGLYRLTSSAGCFDPTNGCPNPTTGKNTYTFSLSYDSIHNITHKTQNALQSGAVNPQTTYDWAYTYPAPGSAHPHSPTAIGPFTISNDADGNQINTLGTGTSDQSQYQYDEENRLSCANKGPQTPSPSCNAQGDTQFIYDYAGERKVKDASSPTIYPNQYYTDFGGGSGNQFKHVFIGSERILTKKARIAPDRQHWYYHTDHLRSTGMVTNENSDIVDAVHYFPFGEVWLEEVPSSLPVDYFFTGKELDQETGFYNFAARYLDPRFSKWMTADPALGDYLAGQAGGVSTPANLSLYAYGRNSPVVYVDPNGRNPLLPAWVWWLIAGGATGGAINVARDRYVNGNFNNAPSAFGQGALFGTGGTALVLVGGTPVAVTMVAIQGSDVLMRAPDYFNNKMSPEDERAFQFDFGTTLFSGATLFAPKAFNNFGRLGGCNSFAEDTPVTTLEGLRPIGELKIGDRVLARSEETGTYTFEPITQVFRHQDPVKVHLTLEDPATGVTEVVETTPQHPFQVPGRGFVPAESLKPNEAVSRAPAGTSSLVRSGRSDTSDVLRVKTLTFENQPFWAYNLEVGEDHTFFVGESRAWVHNAGPCPGLPASAYTEVPTADPFDIVPPAFRVQTSAAFKPGAKQVELKTDLLVFRRENTTPNQGRWVAPLEDYVRAGNARRYLALPDANKATATTAWIIKKGTRVIIGRAETQVGNPAVDAAGKPVFGPYATGGGSQIYVPDLTTMRSPP